MNIKNFLQRVAPTILFVFLFLLTSVTASDVSEKPTHTKAKDITIASIPVPTETIISTVPTEIPEVTIVPTPTEKPQEEPTAKPTATPTAKATKAPEKQYGGISKKEYDLLVHLVNAEAGIDGMKSKIGVANVVLNRVKSKGFPSTITGVIYEKGQFSVVSNGSINKKPSKDSYEAVDRALAGENTVSDCTFFWAEWLDKDHKFLWGMGVRYHYSGTIFSGYIQY